MKSVMPIGLVVAMMALAPAGARADDPPSAASLERVERLSPREKAALKAKLDRFRALPPAERQALLESAKKWRAMPDGEKARVRESYARWRELPPARVRLTHARLLAVGHRAPLLG